MTLSGWCSPPDAHHPRAHARCQEQLDRGLLPRGCECAEHGGHTSKEGDE